MRGLAAFVLIVSCAGAANAEVMQKASVEPMLIGPAVIIVVAFMLSQYKPVAALLAYPLALLLAVLLLDLLTGDFAEAIAREVGSSFLVVTYASMVISIVGPAAVYIFMRRKQLSGDQGQLGVCEYAARRINGREHESGGG